MKHKQHATEQLLDQWWNQRKIKNTPEEKWKWKYNIPKLIRCSKHGTKRAVYSQTALPQEIRKISNIHSNLKELGKSKKKKNKAQTE